MDTRIIEEKFKSLFGNDYMVYTSPGRVNLIGEHTDYNGGFVFPGATLTVLIKFALIHWIMTDKPNSA